MPQQRAAPHQENVNAMATIEARGLRKVFGTTVALDGIDLHVEEGRILGIIGPNGAGKTTALNAILGLTSYEGQLKVLGRDPWKSRDELMRDVSFIADVAVLPRWIRVSQLLDYVAGVHPRFDRAKAESFLARTEIKRTSKVRELSKGMVAQLHLAIVMAIDARLLVLDEPTLGLDILVSETVLRFAAERLLRQESDDYRNHSSGRRSSRRADRSDLHQSWSDRAPVQHGGIRIALCRSDGASRSSCWRTRTETDARTASFRSQRAFV